ncbi:hypothetical protein KVR01_010812 [Diaporthe batatas]|uniref:uncharacterized protein n=1 Tax=Diaporthe batatas TaxID=748121 RepID=UPI001D04DE12|nr:uncharacterized protein KVR01_010812 [Diaporthe batatas]KAG8159151.1 hypothetical protein KVR01_010812 [Diaporthe batatas]
MTQILEEQPVFGAYYSAEALAAQCRHYDDEQTGEEQSSHDGDSEDDVFNKFRKKHITRNVEPVSIIKPEVEYQAKVPSRSSIIGNISHRRLDRVPVAEMGRTDICFPCGLDTYSHPDLRLQELPCGHWWCQRCLARTFKFAIANNTFHRFQCCHEEQIPLRYFRAIIEKKPHPKPEFEPGYEKGSKMEIVLPEEQEAPTFAESRDFNPLRVSESVRKESEVFINKNDWNIYLKKLEEFETRPRDKLYCYRRLCGSFIPLGDRTGTRATCPQCQRVTCCRCRKGWHTHQSKDGKCDAGKERMTVVRNDRKLIVMAKRKGWKRCPRCRMFVEKVKGGCSSVYCICGRHFFYS